MSKIITCIGLARLEEQLRAEKTLRDAHIRSLTTATELAKEAMEFRLSGMNEFRDQLRDQASRFTTRDELESQLRPVLQDIRVLRESKAELAGKASQGAVNLATLIGLIAHFASIVGLLLRLLT